MTVHIDPQGLLNDLLETSSSAYHHHVALLQLEAQKLINALTQKIQNQCNHYLAKYHCGLHQKEQAISAFQLRLNREIAEIRKHCRKMVECERFLSEERETAIREYVELSPK